MVRSRIVTTDNITEGQNNKYFTPERVRNKLDKASDDYLKNASVNGNTLTLTDGQDNIISFTPTGGGGGGAYTAGDGIDIANNVVSLETASETGIGGVKVGDNLSIDANGVLNAIIGDGDSVTVKMGIVEHTSTLGGGGAATIPITFDSPMPDTDYYVGVTKNFYDGQWEYVEERVSDKTVNGCNLKIRNTSNSTTTQKPKYNWMAIHRNSGSGGGGGGGYVLPIASANTLGGIKVGNNLSIDANGVLSATGGGGGSYTAGDGIDITNDVISLEKASANGLGGIKVGSGLSIDNDGVLSVTGGGSTFSQRLIYSGNWTSGNITLTESMQNFDDFAIIYNNGSRTDLAWAVTTFVIKDILVQSTSSSPVSFYGEGSRKFSFYRVDDTHLGFESRDTYGIKRIYGRKY